MQHELRPSYEEDEQRIIDTFDRQEQIRRDQAEFSEQVLTEADSADNAVDAANLIFDAYRSTSNTEADTEEREESELTLKEKFEESYKEIDTLVGLLNKRYSRSQTPEEDVQYKEIRDRIFSDAGFTPKERENILKAWGSYDVDGKDAEELKKEMSPIYRANITRMTEVSLRSPGSAAALHRGYGIRNFGRYSEGHLLNQYEGNINEKPVKVLLAAAHDWNGGMGTTGGLSRDAHDIEMDEPVIVEAETPLEAFRHMLAVKQNFGEIGQAYIAAHGNKDAVELSHNQAGILSAGSLEKSKAIQRLIENGTLTKDVDIILSACFAENLAKEASKQTEGRAMAAGKSLYTSLYTDEKGRIRQDNNHSVLTYERGHRVSGMYRIRAMGRKILQKAGIQLVA